jgi:hypothetical protein
MNKCFSLRIYFPLKWRKQTQYNNIYICTPLHSPRTISICHWVCHYAAMPISEYTSEKPPHTHVRKKGSRKCETAGSFFRCSCQISTIAPRNCDKTSRQAALRQLFWQSNASYTFPPVNILDHINRHLKLDEKNIALKYIYGMITPPPAPK